MRFSDIILSAEIAMSKYGDVDVATYVNGAIKEIDSIQYSPFKVSKQDGIIDSAKESDRPNIVTIGF